MFNRYWREYPWYFQLLQFVILIFVMVMFFSAILSFLAGRTGISLADVAAITENSPRKLIDAALVSQAIMAFGIFLIPAALFAYFTHPEPRRLLGLVKPGRQIQWLLVPMLMLGAMPLLLAIAEWISHIDFGPAARQSQKESDQIFKALLSMDTPLQLLAGFVVLAILPAVGEELFFRGVIMRFSSKFFTQIAGWTNKYRANVIFSVVLSSVMFALMHAGVYGLLSIFLAGCLLATIYYLTGSLWCSILGHMFFNGLQVVAGYFAGNSRQLHAISEANQVPLPLVIGGLVLFLVSFYLLWKNRTPLSPNWTLDYDESEFLDLTRKD